MDITYIPMTRGFVYLAAVVNWYSRRVLTGRVSIILDTAFCVEAVEEAIQRYGKPEIFNTDQGCQVTSEAFTRVLRNAGIVISMDRKGCWRDNVFVERLWKTIKYEGLPQALRHGQPRPPILGALIDFYNTRRQCSSLDRQTPDQVYFNQPLPPAQGSLTRAGIHLSNWARLFK